MAWSDEQLTHRIAERGLPPVVAEIAIRGGASVHPALDYRADAVYWEPALASIEASGRDDLVPLWSTGATTLFSAGDGTFAWISPEDVDPLAVFPDFPSAVRSLLTDLYEDEEAEEDRRTVARLLLPRLKRRWALRPERR